jgi:hypothetical protein
MEAGFEIVLIEEEGMVSVNYFAFFSKDDRRSCHRSHVGLAFDLESLYVDLDCKSAFSHSDHLCLCSCASSGHTQNLKDFSLSDWIDRLHRSAPLGSFQENLVEGGAISERAKSKSVK